MSRDDDLLERATRALRATPPPTDGELAQAKARLLSAHKAATKPNRARSLRWVLPLAAVLAAGTALAAVPQSFERLAEAVVELLAPGSSVASKPKRRPAVARPAPTAAPQVAPTAVAPAPEAAPAPDQDTPEQAAPEQAAPEQAAPAPEAVTAKPAPVPAATQKSRELRAGEPRRMRSVEPAPEPAPAVAQPEPDPAPEPEPIASADLAKYRAAHRAHFQQRDFEAALRGWETYLRQFPLGTFSLEARYNRAICLLRLGRKDEARRALAPFAHGEMANGYRQTEATKLLEALE